MPGVSANTVRFYNSLLKTSRRSHRISLLVSLIVFGVIFACLFALHGEGNVPVFSKAVEPIKNANEGLHMPKVTTFILVLILFLFLRGTRRKKKFYKAIREKRDSLGHNDGSLAKLLRDLYVKAYASKNFIFWVLFLFTGGFFALSINMLVVGGIYSCFSNTGWASGAIFTKNGWKSFNLARPMEVIEFNGTTAMDTPLFFVGLFGFLMFATISLLVHLITKRRMDKIEVLFYDLEIDRFDIVDRRTYKINRRNKTIVYIILVIWGFFIYFVFKKMISSIYNNKSD